MWGAVTGTLGAVIAVRREVVSNRRRLVVYPGVNFTVSRTDPLEVRLAWAAVGVYNGGGRPLAVEHVGFRYGVRYVGRLPHEVREKVEAAAAETGKEPTVVMEHRAEISLNDPIPLPVDGPSHKIYTPLGPVLAAGINPFVPLQAFAITTGGREWLSPAQPLVQTPPPAMTMERVADGLRRLAESSEPPPESGGLVWLTREEPHLIEEP
jgi:hypothetical protein